MRTALYFLQQLHELLGIEQSCLFQATQEAFHPRSAYFTERRMPPSSYQLRSRL
jgi:hypothetical protein